MTDESRPPVYTRGYEANDKAFILATFLRGLYYGDNYYSQMPKNRFMECYHPFLEHLLDSPGIDIKVACLEDDKDIIVGYSMYTNTVLHWVFVKKQWRKIGVAKVLVPEKLTACTHLTELGKQILKKKPGVYFDPYLL